MSALHTALTPDTLPSPPFIPIQGIANFRTIGRHATPDGHHTRSDFVYRCGAPVAAAGGESLVAGLKKLRIGTMYDVRSEREIIRLKAPTDPVEGVERVFCPVFANNDKDAAPDSNARRMADYADVGPGGFVRAYAEILDEGATDAYRRIFEHIRDRPDEPFAVHCTAGKDRTGVAVMLMLNLVGIDDETVATEYNLTELGLKDEVEKWIPHMMKDGPFVNNEPAVRRVLGAKKENMLAALVMLREKWGGAEGYLIKGIGFSKEDVEKIRANLLEPTQ